MADAPPPAYSDVQKQPPDVQASAPYTYSAAPMPYGAPQPYAGAPPVQQPGMAPYPPMGPPQQPYPPAAPGMYAPPPQQPYPPGMMQPQAAPYMPPQPMPGVTAPPPQTTIVVNQPGVVSGVRYHLAPCTTVCPHCRASIISKIHYEVGSFAILLCVLIFFLGGPLGCCLIPLCVTSCQDTVHTCPNCHRRLGTYTRM